jgi:hypothetical protein
VKSERRATPAIASSVAAAMTRARSSPRPSPAVPAPVAIAARIGLGLPGVECLGVFGRAVDGALDGALRFCGAPAARFADGPAAVATELVLVRGVVFGARTGDRRAVVAFDPAAVGICSTYCKTAEAAGGDGDGGEAADAAETPTAPRIAVTQTSKPHRVASDLACRPKASETSKDTHWYRSKPRIEGPLFDLGT